MLVCTREVNKNNHNKNKKKKKELPKKWGFKISTSAYPLDSHPGFSLSSLSLILLCNTLSAKLSQGVEMMTEKKELSKALKRKNQTKKQLKIFASINAEAVILDVSRRRKGWEIKSTSL